MSIVTSFSATAVTTSSVSLNFTVTASCYLYRFSSLSNPQSPPNPLLNGTLIQTIPSAVSNYSFTDSTNISGNTVYTYAFYNGNTSVAIPYTNIVVSVKTNEDLTSLTLSLQTETSVRVNYTFSNKLSTSITAYLYQFANEVAPATLNTTDVNISYISSVTTLSGTISVPTVNTGNVSQTVVSNQSYSYAFYDGQTTGAKMITDASNNAVSTSYISFATVSTLSVTNLFNTIATINYTLTNALTTSTKSYLYRFTGSTAPATLNTATGTNITTNGITTAASSTSSTPINDTGLTIGTQYTYAFYNGTSNGVSTIVADTSRNAQSVTVTSTNITNTSLTASNIAATSATISYSIVNNSSSTPTVYLYRFASGSAPSILTGGTAVTSIPLTANTTTTSSYGDTGLTINTQYTYAFYSGNTSGVSTIMTSDGTSAMSVGVNTTVVTVSFSAATNITNTSATINYSLSYNTTPVPTVYLYRYSGASAPSTLNLSTGTSVGTANTTGAGSLASTSLTAGTQYTYAFYSGNTGGSLVVTDSSGTAQSVTINTTNLLNTSLTASATTITNTTAIISYTLTNSGSNTSATTAYLYRFAGTTAPSTNPTTGTSMTSVSMGVNSTSTSTYTNTGLTVNTQYTYAFYNGNTSSATILANGSAVNQSVTVYTTNIVQNTLTASTITTSSATINYDFSNFTTTTATTVYLYRSTNIPGTTLATSSQTNIITGGVSVAANSTAVNSYNNTGLSTNTVYYYAFYNGNTNGTSTIIPITGQANSYIIVKDFADVLLSSSALTTTSVNITYTINNGISTSLNAYLYRFSGSTAPASNPAGNSGTQVTNSGTTINPIVVASTTSVGPTTITDNTLSTNNTYTYALYTATNGNILANTTGTAVSVTIVTYLTASSISLTSSSSTSTIVNYSMNNPTSVSITTYLYRFVGNSAPISNPTAAGTYISSTTVNTSSNATPSTITSSGLTPNTQYTWAFYTGQTSTDTIITNNSGNVQSVTLLTAMYVRSGNTTISAVGNTYITLGYRLGSGQAITQTSYMYRFNGSTAPSPLDNSGVLVLNTSSTSTASYNNTGLTPNTQYTYAFYNGSFVTAPSPYTPLYTGSSSAAVNVPLTVFTMSTTTPNLLNTALTASTINASASISYTITNNPSSVSGSYYLYRFAGAYNATTFATLNTGTGTSVTLATNTIAANTTNSTTVTNTGLTSATQYTYAFYNGNSNGLSTILTDGTSAKYVTVTTTGVFEPTATATSISNTGATYNYTLTNAAASPAVSIPLYLYNSTTAPATYNGLGTLVTTFSLGATTNAAINTTGTYNITGLTTNSIYTLQAYNGNISGFSPALQTTLAGGTQQSVSLKTDVSDTALSNSNILNTSAIISYTLSNTLGSSVTSYLYRFTGSSVPATLTVAGTQVTAITTSSGTNTTPTVNTSTYNSTGLSANTTYVYGFYNGTSAGTSTLLTNVTGAQVSTSFTTSNLFDSAIGFNTLSTTSVTITYTLTNTGTNAASATAYLYRFAGSTAPSTNPTTSGTQVTSVSVGTNTTSNSTYNNTGLTANTQYTYAFYNGSASTSTILTTSGLVAQSVTIFTTTDIIVNTFTPLSIGPITSGTSQTNLSYSLVNYQNVTKTAYLYRYNATTSAPSTLNTSGVQLTNVSNPVIPIVIGPGATLSSTGYNNTGLTTNTNYTYAFYNSTTSASASILKASTGVGATAVIFTTDNAIVGSITSSNLGNTINTINWNISNSQSGTKTVYLYRFTGTTVPSPLSSADLLNATLLTTITIPANGGSSISSFNDSGLTINTNYSYAFYNGNTAGAITLTTFSGTAQVLNIATTQMYNPTLTTSYTTQTSTQINYTLTNTPSSSGDIVYLYRFTGATAPSVLSTTGSYASATQIGQVVVFANSSTTSSTIDSTLSTNTQYTYAFYNGSVDGIAQILTYSTLADYASVTISTFYDVITALNSTYTTNTATTVTYTLQNNLSTDSTAYLYRFDGNVTVVNVLNTLLYNATNVTNVPVTSNTTVTSSFYDSSLTYNSTYTYSFYSGTTSGVSTVITNSSNVPQKTVVNTLNVYNPSLSAPTITTSSVSVAYTINNAVSNADATVYLYRFLGTSAPSTLTNAGTMMTSLTVLTGNSTTSAYTDSSVTADQVYTYAFYNGNQVNYSPILQDASSTLVNVSVTVYTFYDIIPTLTTSYVTNTAALVSYSIQNTLTVSTTGYLYRYTGSSAPSALNTGTGTYLTNVTVASTSSVNGTYYNISLTPNTTYTYAFYNGTSSGSSVILTNSVNVPVMTSATTLNVYNPTLSAPTITTSSVTINYVINNTVSSETATVYLYRFVGSSAPLAYDGTGTYMKTQVVQFGNNVTSSYIDATTVPDTIYTYAFYNGNATGTYASPILTDTSSHLAPVSVTVLTFYDIVATLSYSNLQNTSVVLNSTIQNTLTITTNAYLYRFNGSIIPSTLLNTSTATYITYYTINGSAIITSQTTDNTLTINSEYTYALYSGNVNGVSVLLTDINNVPQYVVVSTSNVNAPVAHNVTASLMQDTATFIVLNATDLQGNLPLTYTYTSPKYGLLSGTAPNLVYVPNTGYYGHDEMLYYATNVYNYTSNVASVGIVVQQSQPPVPCFGKGTYITCLSEEGNEVQLAVESLRKGTMVKTYKHSYVPVHQVGESTIYTPPHTERMMHRLYRISKYKFPMIECDLIMTGGHSILVDTLEEVKQIDGCKQIDEQNYFTDDKMRVMTYTLKDAEICEEAGVNPIYHFSLENDDIYANYGVYANGMLVETCSIRYLRDYSNMKDI
jgi:hypothetical protein